MTLELVWECQYTLCSVKKEQGAATLDICGIQDNENAETLGTERQSTHITVLNQQFQSHHMLIGPKLA